MTEPTDVGGWVRYAPPPQPRVWAVPPRPGVPFHQVARTAAHRWWRPVLAALALVGGGLVVAITLTIISMIITVIATGKVPHGEGGKTFANPTADMAINLLMLALLLPVALLVAWGVERRRPGTLASVTGRLRVRWLLVCCGVTLPVMALSYAGSILAGEIAGDPPEYGHWVGWSAFLAPALVIVLLVPFQSAAEEFVFRGWILQAVGSCTLQDSTRPLGRALSKVFRTPWPGIVTGSILFMFAHGYRGWGLLDIFAFGAIAAWLAVRTGGLEASIALHVFNNLVAFLPMAAAGQLDIEQGDIPWPYVVADVLSILLYAAVITWLARRRRIAAVTPEHPTTAAPPAALG
ncbi:CPBP family intramembrane glutamic endopeptidase [Actinomadura macrotermitis]|uniref:CAAX prenyl protease 2/Lysostaphin resistance protein A-like domain-containing protein n=1 Tax=Actinomadura macrotermitis TaxID=2585200 RepID=A0A7K0BR43_9ACTN|nr:CPBP family intramembrane glutamic endopeptidase [Actinomadura macrotermitis]MQY03611.1 hypothetical protein [Actinomadura macrotermitis]